MKKIFKASFFAFGLLSSTLVYANGEWINMGNYGFGYENLCHYHRNTYMAMNLPAECVPNANGVTLWVYYRY